MTTKEMSDFLNSLWCWARCTEEEQRKLSEIADYLSNRENEKNDLEVLRDIHVGKDILVGFKQGVNSIRALPSVTPQLSSELEKNSKKLEKNIGELDCISREQALRELKESAENHANDSREETLLRRDRDIIRALPSVTPQELRKITLEDVKGYCEPRCLTIISNELLYKLTHPKIKELEQEPQSFKWCTDCKEYDQGKHCCHRYSKVIRDTVAVIEQDPKTGHWILVHPLQENDGGAYMCSNCKTGDWSYQSDYNFCPNCGANMVEPQESEEE